MFLYLNFPKIKTYLEENFPNFKDIFGYMIEYQAAETSLCIKDFENTIEEIKDDIFSKHSAFIFDTDFESPHHDFQLQSVQGFHASSPPIKSAISRIMSSVVVSRTSTRLSILGVGAGFNASSWAAISSGVHSTGCPSASLYRYAPPSVVRGPGK